MNFPDKSARPTFTIKTLGCKVNQYESQAMRESLLRNGFSEEIGEEKTDFFIINSCTVTGKADRDTRNLIRHFHRRNPKGKIVVAGCYAELDSDREMLANMPGVIHLVRNREKGRITEILTTDDGRQATDEKSGITDFKDRNRAFVKIQDGCDYRCSYCKVSIVRGPSRSRGLEEIVKEVRCLIEKGFKEIVLTGVCLGAWGKDLTDPNQPPRLTGVGWESGLAGLIKKLSRLEDKFRIRLSSIEPGYVIDEIIGMLRNNAKVCKHLHMPLQSGDDRVLKLMNRPYTTGKFTQLVKKARKHIPDMAITTDVLLGFPGEDNKSFQRTEKFIKDIRPSRIHVFSYSKREGTAAAKFKSYTDKKEVRERVNIITDLGKRLQADFAKRFAGKPQEVLIESQRDRSTGLLTGYTDRYVRVLTDGPDSLKSCLVSVRSWSPRLDNRQII